MHKLLSRLSTAAPLLAASLLFLPTSSYAQRAKVAEAGNTTVTLAAGFVSALDQLGVAVGTINPTELEGGKVNFPITSGVIDLDTAKIELLHSGGLRFTAGSTEVDLSSFIIDNTGSMPVITGLVVVDHKLLGRIVLFDLVLPSGITLPLKPSHGRLAIGGVGVNLDATAATALNHIYHVGAFKAGFNIGTARVVAFLHSCDDDRDDED